MGVYYTLLYFNVVVKGALENAEGFISLVATVVKESAMTWLFTYNLIL